MKNTMRIAALILLTRLTVDACRAEDVSVRFSVDDTTSATVTIFNSKVRYTLSNGQENSSGEFEVQTETQKKITYSDYNFDGEIDFSIWYIDEGMGSNTIHRVFLYSRNKRTFVEYQPRCADEFINLKVDKENKKLMSTYYVENTPTTCATKPPKNPK